MTLTTYINGKIFTSDPDQLYVDAMVEDNDKITLVG